MKKYIESSKYLEKYKKDKIKYIANARQLKKQRLGQFKKFECVTST